MITSPAALPRAAQAQIPLPQLKQLTRSEETVEPEPGTQSEARPVPRHPDPHHRSHRQGRGRGPQLVRFPVGPFIQEPPTQLQHWSGPRKPPPRFKKRTLRDIPRHVLLEKAHQELAEQRALIPRVTVHDRLQHHPLPEIYWDDELDEEWADEVAAAADGDGGSDSNGEVDYPDEEESDEWSDGDEDDEGYGRRRGRGR